MIDWFLYFSINSSAPEKAIWLIYSSTSAVGHGQRFGLLVHGDVNRQVAQLALHFADRRKRLQFLGSIDRIGNQLAQENFMVRIEELFNHGEDILRRNPDFAVFHSFIFSCILIHFIRPSINKPCATARFLPNCQSGMTKAAVKSCRGGNFAVYLSDFKQLPLWIFSL